MSRVKKGVRELVAEAEAVVETLSIDEAERLREEGGALLVDLRDVRELAREGKVPGAFHAPRGMIEFWVDPESPYHNETLSSAMISRRTSSAAAPRARTSLLKSKRRGFRVSASTPKTGASVLRKSQSVCT